MYSRLQWPDAPDQSGGALDRFSREEDKEKMKDYGAPNQYGGHRTSRV
jgi:hypothetical protein